MIWQCLMPQPHNNSVLGSQGQSQLPGLVLLDELLPSSTSAHGRGAACLCLSQACRPCLMPKGTLTWPSCCRVCTLLCLCLFPLLLLGDPRGGWLQPERWDQVLCILSLACCGVMLTCTGMASGQCGLPAALRQEPKRSAEAVE